MKMLHQFHEPHYLFAALCIWLLVAFLGLQSVVHYLDDRQFPYSETIVIHPEIISSEGFILWGQGNSSGKTMHTEIRQQALSATPRDVQQGPRILESEDQLRQKCTPLNECVDSL